MRLRTILATSSATAVTALVGGLATGSAAQSAWYKSLRKPPYQPPPQVFPVVWPLLYADIATVSAATLDDQPRPDERRRYLVALAANLVVNAGWSWLFFNRRQLGAAAITAGVLTASSADLTRRAGAVSGKRAVALAPYPLWCAFATVLSTHIWILNKR